VIREADPLGIDVHVIALRKTAQGKTAQGKTAQGKTAQSPSPGGAGW
jgi:hypothetical protein